MNSLQIMWDHIVDFVAGLTPSVMERYLLSIGASIGLLLDLALGGFDAPISGLIALTIADYTTGVVAACRTGEWDSSVGFVGLAKKAVIFLVVALCHWLDACVGADMLRQMAICAYAVNELGSNLENIDKAGFGNYIPAGVRNMLARLKATTDKGELPNGTPKK